MIPNEVAKIADAINSAWPDLSDEESERVIDAAWRVYDAGFRKIAEPAT